MKKPTETGSQDGLLALQSRRKFLKRALITAAYVAPVVLSYSSSVFAAHCSETGGGACGGADHVDSMGMIWSPGCSMLNF